MSLNTQISELNGYLKALQKLAGNRFSYGVRYYSAKEESVEDFILSKIEFWGEEDRLSYQGLSEIGYKDLMREIKRFIFNGVLSKDAIGNPKAIDYLESILLEDINEFYSQASLSDSSSNTAYPLIEGPIYQIMIDDKAKSETLFYVIKIGDTYVLTFFSK